MDPKVGMLSQENLTDREFKAFLDILREVKKSTVYDFLYYILKEETLMFLDVFADDTIKVPSREEIFKLLDYAKIYTFYIENRDDPEVIKKASKKFQRRTQSIIRIVNKAEEMIKSRGEEAIWESHKT